MLQVERTRAGGGGVETGAHAIRRLVAQVYQTYGVTGACLLASGLRGGAIASRGVESLHAVGTFFHDSAWAQADLRVGRGGCYPSGGGAVVAVIEMASTVGAGGCAVAGAPAAGVDHGIEPFIRMHGSMYRAYGLAGGLLALAAGYGQIH